jgi:beta-lactamase regulating signal transducer with metallopeptidase domain
MISEALQFLARANLSGSLAIAVAALLRRPVRATFGASAAYALWGTPVMAAAASLFPTPEGGLIAPRSLGAASGLWTAIHSGAGPVPPAIVGGAWALGALLSAAMLGARQLQCASAIRGATPRSVCGVAVFQAARADVGPAVVGRAIILPHDFDVRFTPAEQAAIIAHETHHLARGDVIANAVVALIQCFCWFNPLVHLAARWVRIDQELACDAAVISKRPALRRPYGEALLKAQMGAAQAPVGCAWRSRGFAALRDRIRLLNHRGPSRRRRACGVLLLGVLTFGGGYAAWAAQPAQMRTIADPDWSRLPTGADLVRFYPHEALVRELAGHVVMRCRVGRVGAVSHCAIEDEAPLGGGFGRAVLQMAPLFRMKPVSLSGRPVAGASVRIPVSFKLSSDGAGGS